MRFACTNVVALSLLTTNMAPAFQVTSPHMLRSRQHVHARVVSLLRGIEDPMDVEVTGKKKKDVIAHNRTKTQTLNKQPESLKPTQNFGPVPFNAPKIGRTEYSYRAAKVRIIEKPVEPPPRRVAPNTPQAPDFAPTRKEAPPIRKAPTATDIAAAAAATAAAAQAAAEVATAQAAAAQAAAAAATAAAATAAAEVATAQAATAQAAAIAAAATAATAATAAAAAQAPPTPMAATTKSISVTNSATSLPKSKKPALDSGPVAFRSPKVPPPASQRKAETAVDSGSGLDSNVATKPPPADASTNTTATADSANANANAKAAKKYKAANLPGGGAIPFERMTDAPMGPQKYWEEELYMDHEPPRNNVWSAHDLQEVPEVTRGRGQRTPPTNDYYEEGRDRGRRPPPSNEYYQARPEVTNDRRRGRRNPPDEYEQRTDVTNDRPDRRNPPNDYDQGPQVTNDRRRNPPNEYEQRTDVTNDRPDRRNPPNDYDQGPQVTNDRRRNPPNEYEQRTDVTNDGPDRRNPPNDYEQGPQVTNDRRRSPPPSGDLWTPKEETNEPEVPAPPIRVNRGPPAPPVPFKTQAPVPMGEIKKSKVTTTHKRVLWEAPKVRVVPQMDTATSPAAKVDTAAPPTAKVDTAAPPTDNVLKVDITPPAANVAPVAKASAAAKSPPNTKASPPMSPFTATEDMGKRKKEAPTEVMTTSSPQSVVAPPLPIPKDEVSDIDPPAAAATPKEKVVAAPKEEVPDIAPPAPVAVTATASKAPPKSVSDVEPPAPTVVDVAPPVPKEADVAPPARKIVDVAELFDVTQIKNAPNGAARTTNRSAYSHSNDCFPSQVQLVNNKRSTGSSIRNRSIHEQPAGSTNGSAYGHSNDCFPTQVQLVNNKRSTGSSIRNRSIHEQPAGGTATATATTTTSDIGLGGENKELDYDSIMDICRDFTANVVKLPKAKRAKLVDALAVLTQISNQNDDGDDNDDDSSLNGGPHFSISYSGGNININNGRQVGP